MKTCPTVASAEEAAQAEQQLVNNTRATKGEFTLRDEANALTAFSFRNGFLEDLHGGKSSPVPEPTGLQSHIGRGNEAIDDRGVRET